MALLIYDTFKGHTGEEMDSVLVKNLLSFLLIALTSSSCLIFLSTNLLKTISSSLFSHEVSSQLQGGKKAEDITVDTKLTIMKPLGVKWIRISVRDC